MAIKITGYFQNPTQKQLYDSPNLILVPHLAPFGNILMDVNIVDDEQQHIGGFAMEVDRAYLVYDDDIEDGHDRLFVALQDYTMGYLPTTNAANEKCTYATISPTKTTLE